MDAAALGGKKDKIFRPSLKKQFSVERRTRKCSHYLLILMTRESQVMFRSQLNISEASQRDGVLLNNCRKQQENTLDAWFNSSANTDRVCANAFSFAAAVKIWVLKRV